MRDLLASLGALVTADLALFVTLWTVVALLAEGALRTMHAHALVSRPVRMATLSALPLGLAAAIVASRVPSAPLAAPVLAWRERVLPTLVVGTDAPAAAVASGVPLATLLLGAVVAAVLAVGAVAAVRLSVSVLRLRRWHLPDAPPDVQAHAARVFAQAGVMRPVRVAVASAGTVPVTFGMRHPVVVVPDGLGGEALELALAHEAAHIRAGDAGRRLLAEVLAAPVAAHPLVPVLMRGLALDAERLADAAVIEHHGRRRAYADLLLSFASCPVPRLAIGAVPGSSSLLLRLTAMSRPSPSPATARRLGAGARLAAVALAGSLVALAGWTGLRPAGEHRFLLDRAVVTLDGVEVISPNTVMRADEFVYYTVNVEGFGRMVVSDAPFAGSARAGAFDGRVLQVSAGGHTLRAEARAPILYAGDRAVDGPVTAHARFDATPGARPLRAGAVVASHGVHGSPDGLAAWPHRVALPDAPAPPSPPRSPAAAPAAAPPAPPAPSTPPRSVAPPAPAPPSPPVMVGGIEGLMQRLVYPDDARADGVQGMAVVSFTVRPDGSLSDAEIVRSAGDERLDRAALAAVRETSFEPMPGSDTSQRLSLPIRFALPAPVQSER